MMYGISAILFLLWLLGMAFQYTMGGFIHLLLVIALLVILLKVIGGRNSSEYFTESRLKYLHQGFVMNKTMSFVLLFGGILLLLFAIQQTESFSLEVSHILNSTVPTKILWVYVAGVIGSSIGLVGLLNAFKKDMKRR